MAMKLIRFQKTVCRTIVVLALCVVSRPASTQTVLTGEAASQKADEYFQQGKSLYKLNKLKDARDAYLSAWNLKRSYDIAANLANAELQIGMKRDAAEHFAFCIRSFPPTGSKAQLDAVKARFEEARSEIGVLLVKTSTDGADLFLDGKPLGRMPSSEEIFVEPGARTLEAKLVGYATATQVVQVRKGQAQTVTLTLVPAVPTAPTSSVEPRRSASGSGAPPPPPPIGGTATPPTKSGGPSRALLVAGGALAAGGMAAGIGFTVAANNKSAEADEIGARLGGRTTCTPTSATAGSSDCKAVKSALTNQSTLSNAALAGFAVGGAFALATAGLGVWSLLTPQKENKVTVRAVPVAGAQGGGLSVVGTW